MALCLPRDNDINRKRLAKMALTSSFTCLGQSTDHCSEWPAKKAEVRRILFDLLPLDKAADLYELYEAHVKARIGSHLVTKEEVAYRKLLEFEELLLQWEELKKEGAEIKETFPSLIRKMCEVGFPGHEKVRMFKDPAELTILLNFFLQISGLCSLRRTGWVRMKIRDPERVAGHMYRMGVMAMVLEDELNSRSSVIQDGSSVIITILHDVAECIVGDITPVDKVTPEDKHQQEMKAMKSLVEKLPGPLACELYSAFLRYEFQRESDHEAIVTKDLDKYDMILQAQDYEEQGLKGNRGRFLEEFFTSTQDVFKSGKVKTLVKHLLELRENMHDKAGNNST